jgi:hypothetical protein
MAMTVKRKFWILYLIFAALNMLDYYSTAICYLLPGFEEQNPLVKSILTNQIGLFLDVKLSIIFAMGALAGLVLKVGKEEGLKLINRGLIVLNSILAVVSAVNILQLIYYLTA